MSIKDLQKYKCDECGKNFTLNNGSKGYIAAAHKKKIQLWSMWQKFGYSLQDAILCKKYSTNHSQYTLRSIIACNKKNRCIVAISKQMCKQLACTQWNQF